MEPKEVAAKPLAVQLLTAAQILESDDFTFKDVEVPEWKGIVRIRNLTAEGRGLFVQRSLEAKHAQETYLKDCDKARKENLPLPPKPLPFDAESILVAMTAVDANGASIFTETDVNRLKHKSAKAMSRVSAVAQELSGMVEAPAEKPSAETPSDGSSSV